MCSINHAEITYHQKERPSGKVRFNIGSLYRQYFVIFYHLTSVCFEMHFVLLYMGDNVLVAYLLLSHIWRKFLAFE